MTYLRMLMIAGTLLGVFLLGMALTWPELLHSANGFPINRQFIAVSLNGQPFNYERMPYHPTFEVRPSTLLRFRTHGNGGCNAWSGALSFASGQSIAWKDVAITKSTCIATPIEGPYLKALLATTRWRRDGGTLILENDKDVLRFMLAPR
jgi:heat shock protein HslJ